MPRIPTPNVALYTEAVLTPDAVSALCSSGFSTIIVGLFHVHKDGSLYYNDDPVSAATATIIASLKQTPGSRVQCVFMSIGGGNWRGHPASVSDSDYPAMKATWTQPAPGQSLTSKAAILQLMRAGNIDGLDLDYEPVTTPFDVDFIAQIATEISAAGHLVSAAPYQDHGHWGSVLSQTTTSSGNCFTRWNLQLYGGADYATWVAYLGTLSAQTNINDPQRFLVPGYSIACGSTPNDDPGQPLNQLAQQYPTLDGAFIWNSTSIADCLATEASAIQATLGNAVVREA